MTLHHRKHDFDSMESAVPAAKQSACPESSADFQQLLLERADLATDWLVRSIEANRRQGSSAYYSRIFKPFHGWAAPYPETTGYLIPSLLEYSQFAHRPDLQPLALTLADWLMSLQYQSGAFPGGFVKNGRKAGPSVFNTAQIIKGLLASDAISPQRGRYLECAVRAAHWLAQTIDPEAGIWTAHAYRKGFSPAYYTQVCWPMLALAKRTGDAELERSAVSVLGTIAGWQLPNGAIKNWAFAPRQPAFTHTIAYTLEGFIECADLLDGEGEQLRSIAEWPAATLRSHVEAHGNLAGAYTENFDGVHWYSCLTGHCQMVVVWIKLYQTTGDMRYLTTALEMLQYVLDRQKLRGQVRGALAGSSPIWGRYLVFRYPNWAAKHLLDATMLAHGELEQRSAVGS